jgi:hypothetical protein
MTTRSLTVLTMCSALALAATGCLRNADASAASTAPKSAPRDAGADQRSGVAAAPTDAAAAQMALKWLSSLRRRDQAELVRQSGVPFVLRDASSTGACSTIDIAESSKLDNLSCLVSDAPLHEVLVLNPEPEPGLVAPKHLPKWARKWKIEVTPDLTPVSFVLLGKKASFDLVVLVGTDGVHGLFRYAAGDRL